MTTAAKSILQRVVVTLQDDDSTRWTMPELVRYLNDGLREFALLRADQVSKSVVFDCVAGSRQVLPAEASALVDVSGNAAAGSSLAPVSVADRAMLDAVAPGWRNETASIDVIHFVHDLRDPRVFYTYPPATATAKLDLTYTVIPAFIAEPAVDADFNDVVGNVGIPDIYANALTDYVLYRAYTKDSEYAGNAARAQAHYAAFGGALGSDLKSVVAISPNQAGRVRGTPAV